MAENKLCIGRLLFVLDYSKHIKRVRIVELREEEFTVSSGNTFCYNEIGKKIFFDEYDLRKRYGLQSARNDIDTDVLMAFRNSHGTRRDTKGTKITRTSSDFDKIEDAFIDFVSPNEYHASLTEWEEMEAEYPKYWDY